MPNVANFMVTPRELCYIAPTIILTLWGLIVLCWDLAILRHRSPEARCRILGRASFVVSIATLLFAVVCLLPVVILPDPWNDDLAIFSGMIAGDLSTLTLNVVILALLAVVTGLSMTWDFTSHWGEYHALLAWSCVGMMLLVASEELLTLFLSLETMTICLYLVTSFEKARRRSAEGGLKYFVYGSVSSAVFLFGLSLLYGLTGTTRIESIRQTLIASGGLPGLTGNLAGALAVLMLLVGFGFKVAAVPFHQWAPDAYEGAPAPVSAWIAAGSKLASFAALAKVLVEGLSTWGTRPGDYTAPGWVGILAILAAVSMTYGNYAALVQKNLKRMLAYSSIAHAGYLLVGVLAASISISGRESMGSVLYYLIFYAFATAGGFALAAWLARDLKSDEIDDLAGLGRREPLLGFSIVVLMLSLIGMPPLAGFFGKLFMFMEAINTRESDRLTMIWLVALGLFNSVVSAFYYVRVLKVMYLREPQAGRAPLAAPGVAVRWSIGVATLLVILFGLVPTPVIDSMKAASIQMLTPGNTLAPKAGRYSTQADPNFDPAEAFKRDAEKYKGRRPGAAG